MNTLLSLLALLFILQSCEFDEEFEDQKDYKTQVKDINKHADFDEIQISGAANLQVVKGDKHRVVLKGNSKHFKYILFNADGNTLECRTRKNSPSNLNVTVHVTLPNIERIAISGAGEIEMASFDSLTTLEIDLTGAGSFETIGNPTKVKELDISISGAGDVEANKLIAERVDVEVSGAGNAEVHATKELNAKVSGVGSIEYEGNPKVKKRISGIGSISKN
jgi:Putative auto-transporter adhesin, head GIN domain